MGNQLLDAGASDERHPLADLVDTLGSLIAEYDDKHFPLQQVSPIEVLQFLMEQHQLTQSDLPEIDSQGVVSEILRGKRDLNLRQVKALTERFVSARPCSSASASRFSTPQKKMAAAHHCGHF